MLRRFSVWGTAFLATVLMGQVSQARQPLPVFVSIVPQKHFVQQIGKSRVDVKVMVQPGANPATYEPKPRQMAGLSKSKLYFAVGVPFESAWLDKIVAANPNMKVVHTDAGIDKMPMAVYHHHDDESVEGIEADAGHKNGQHPGEAGDEKDQIEHTGLDPHIWLSPPLVKIQAGTILAALKDVDPVHGSLYEANFRDFVAQIDQLDDELKTIFAGKKGRQFMVFHPAWGYFAHTYGLEQVPIEIEGKNPKPAQLQALIEHAREKQIRVIFVQPQFSAKSAELVARGIDGKVVLADPLAGDWPANLRRVAGEFSSALK